MISPSKSYKFTGKERDSESGLDNFGARYDNSSLGRFMSPDPINLTARRLVNPANTLNKYVYGGNNPLLYVDPDGLDITVFYRQGQFGNPADYGHIFIAATNQQTGKVKFLDFYPEGSKTVLNQNMTAERLNQHAAITIQTTPEVAQKVIDFIEKLEKNTPDFAALSNNCTTICKEAMAIVRIDFPGGIFPDGLWSALYAQYSDEALSDREQLGNPFFAPLPRYQPGVDFGRTSFLPRGSGFSVFDLFSLMLRSQSHKGTACVTTQGPKGPETTCEPN
jgi:RHS repeat-associated protein